MCCTMCRHRFGLRICAGLRPRTEIPQRSVSNSQGAPTHLGTRAPRPFTANVWYAAVDETAVCTCEVAHVHLMLPLTYVGVFVWFLQVTKGLRAWGTRHKSPVRHCVTCCCPVPAVQWAHVGYIYAAQYPAPQLCNVVSDHVHATLLLVFPSRAAAASLHAVGARGVLVHSTENPSASPTLNAVVQASAPLGVCKRCDQPRVMRCQTHKPTYTVLSAERLFFFFFFFLVKRWS